MPISRQFFRKSFVLAIFLCVSIPSVSAITSPVTEFLTYGELVELYNRAIPPEQLQTKLNRVLTTPFVSNQASATGTRALKPVNPDLGRCLRIAHWNIERGLEYEALAKALAGSSEFASLLDPAKFPPDSAKRLEVLKQAALLRDADIIVLNEVDWGMKRTGYRNVAAELASVLGMNYAYGVEFIEIDPIALGTEEFAGVAAEQRDVLAEQVSIDPERYKGLHGTAILSRLPLVNARIIRYQTQGHDWYTDEKKRVTKIEKGKRKASQIAFKEKIQREVRRGGRMMLLAEVEDIDIPGGRLTIVATHLESKTKPRHRVKQLEELLAAVKDVRHPVVVAGDFNTSTRDNTPTSITREIKKRFGSKKYWVKESLKFFLGLSWADSLVLGGINEYRRQADPTVSHVPLIGANPEAQFFRRLKKFRFDDGGSFDFRGEHQRTAGNSNGVLANSNQRGGKGFITTYEVERPIGFVGRFKLDWIFIKPPALKAPLDKSQPYLFAPHFGRTLKALNYSLEDRISDHDPMIVDLPLTEPVVR